MMYCN